MTEPRHACPISWDQLHRDSRELARRLLDQGPQGGGWRGIVAITRGGLVPAAIIARELDLRRIYTIGVVTYDDRQVGEPTVIKGLDADPDGPRAEGGAGWLIIDDLVDTGTTGRVVRAELPNACFATVYAKPAAADLVDIHITAVSQDTWIYFPWDTDHLPNQPIAARRS